MITQDKLSRLILKTIGAILISWTNPLASSKAIAQTSLIPAPSFQEKSGELPTTEVNTLPAKVNISIGYGKEAKEARVAEGRKGMSSKTTSPPLSVKTAVFNDAVKRISRTVSAMRILEVQQQQWSDGCLGFGKSDEICTQAITPGYQVVVTDGLKNWTYRTDDTGDAVRLERPDGSSK